MDMAIDRGKINPIWTILYSIVAFLMASINENVVVPFRRETSSAGAWRFNAERYMEEYGNMILRYAYSYVHNIDDAEDILQETFIKVLEANPSFENANHEKAYILRTVSNIAKNLLNYGKRRDDDWLTKILEAAEREDLSFVWDAVKELPEMQSAAIFLFFHEGYHIREIAYILGREESTVRSDLNRGKKHLKEILKEKYDFE